MRVKVEIQDIKTERGKNRSETLNNLENLQEELRFLSELDDTTKPQTVQAEREKKTEIKSKFPPPLKK